MNFIVYIYYIPHKVDFKRILASLFKLKVSSSSSFCNESFGNTFYEEQVYHESHAGTPNECLTIHLRYMSMAGEMNAH